MIVFENKNGWGESRRLIRYCSGWSIFFRNKGRMRFFPGKISNIFEAYTRTDGDIAVVFYPHNSEELALTISKQEKDLEELLKNLVIAPIIYEDGKFSYLTKDRFENYYPSIEVAMDEMFIFSNDDKLLGFPNIGVMQSETKKQYPELLKIFAETSGDVLECASSPTDIGKELVYTLLNSSIHREFKLRLNISVNTLDFPTNGESEVRKQFSLKNLEKFADQCGADMVKAGVNGNYYNETEGLKEIPDELSDEEEERLFGKAPLDELLDIVERDAMEKEEIQLSDLFELGAEKVLSKLPFTDRIINILPNIPEIARKMCIYEGLVHIIPVYEDFSPSDAFGEPEELFRICTDESSFPKKYVSNSTQYVQ